MLLRMSPADATKYWTVIQNKIRPSLPPIVDEMEVMLGNLLLAIQREDMTVWLIYEEIEGQKVSKGLYFTTVVYDAITNTKNILAYALVNLTDAKIQDATWKNLLDTISKFGAQYGCSKIVAYSRNPYGIELAKRHGCDTSWTLVSYDIAQGGK